VDETSSGSCPIVGFGVSVEPSEAAWLVRNKALQTSYDEN
jgi:hypothetical protein